MKKQLLGILVATIIVMGGLFVIKLSLGTRPFQNISVSEILKASVKLLPPDVEIELEQDEIEELVGILHAVIIYQEDNSYNDYEGQAVVYTITNEDGSQVTINAYNPFLVIDGKGYRTKYEPCEQLNSLGNQIRRSRG